MIRCRRRLLFLLLKLCACLSQQSLKIADKQRSENQSASRIFNSLRWRDYSRCIYICDFSWYNAREQDSATPWLLEISLGSRIIDYFYLSFVIFCVTIPKLQQWLKYFETQISWKKTGRFRKMDHNCLAFYIAWRFALGESFQRHIKYDKKNHIKTRIFESCSGRLDFRRSLVSGSTFLPEKSAFGEKRGLLSRTAAGNQAYCSGSNYRIQGHFRPPVLQEPTLKRSIDIPSDLDIRKCP